MLMIVRAFWMKVYMQVVEDKIISRANSYLELPLQNLESTIIARRYVNDIRINP